MQSPSGPILRFSITSALYQLQKEKNTMKNFTVIDRVNNGCVKPKQSSYLYLSWVSGVMVSDLGSIPKVNQILPMLTLGKSTKIP